MPTNYSFPENKPIFNRQGFIIADNFSHLVSGNKIYDFLDGTEDLGLATNIGNIFTGKPYWHGSSLGGSLSDNCNGFTSNSGSNNAKVSSNLIITLQQLQNHVEMFRI